MEHEKQFHEAEEARSRHFDAFCGQQELAFEEAQRRRRDGEVSRDKEFKTFLQDVEHELSDSLEKHRLSFLRAAERYERDYEVAEEERDKLFEECRADREKTFFASLEEMRNFARREAETRERVFENSHKRRQKQFEQLVGSIQTRFHVLLNSGSDEGFQISWAQVIVSLVSPLPLFVHGSGSTNVPGTSKGAFSQE